MRRQPIEELEPRLSPTASRVSDINPQLAGSSLRDAITHQDVTYFFANDRLHGTELWKSDGTSSGTVMVRDINPGAGSSTPRQFITQPSPYFTEMNGTLYFAASDGVNGIQIWRTDGMASGTVIVTNPALGMNGARYITNVGGKLYFQSSTTATGTELFACDGTPAGTHLVKDVYPGTNGTFFNTREARYANAGGRLVFFANDGVNGKALWGSDGTAAGTTLISHVDPYYAGGVDVPRVALNGVVYFPGNDTATGVELWRTDGTSTGTGMVYDNPAASSTPLGFTVYDNRVYFGANSKELWSTDGTSIGTVLVRTLPTTPSGGMDNLTVVNGVLFFSITATSLRKELWASDGTSAGTVKLKEIGTSTSQFRDSNGLLYFYGQSFNFDDALWVSDGTSTGTRPVVDLYPGTPLSSITEIVATPGGVLFRADNGTVSNELFRSDGTSAGTVLVRDIQPGNVGSNPSQLTNFNGTLMFSAFEPQISRELWRSDGTPGGTALVRDITTTPGGSTPILMTPVNNKLFFHTFGMSPPNQIWASDGTSAGTTLAKAIVNGTVGTFTLGFLHNINDRLYFGAFDSDDYGLWTSDGTSTGTVMVYGPNQFKTVPSYLTNLNGIIYFNGGNGTYPGNTKQGNELWRSDGTSSGTYIVRDISPQAGSPVSDNPSSNPRDLVAHQGHIYFHCVTPGIGGELWMSDGTSSGTVLVRDIQPGSGFGFISTPDSQLTSVGTSLYFVANDGATGRELWKTDGTSAGTVLVRDIAPGSAGSDPIELRAFGDRLVFTARGPDGDELWISDGTSAGTSQLRDIRPGAAGSTPLDLTVVNQWLYFTADDGATGRELWASDGTSSGTALAHDLRAGPDTSSPLYLVNVSGTLFFTADADTASNEIWKVADTKAPTVTAITSASPNGAYVTGESVSVTIRFPEPVTLVGTLAVTLDTGAVVSIGPFTGTTATAVYTIQAGEISADLNVVGLNVTGTLTDTAGNAAVLSLPASNLANNANLIINPPPPTTVTMLTINDGDVQRSRIMKLDVTLSAAVPLASLGAITVTRAGTPFTVDASNGLVAIMTGYVLTLTFTGLDSGSLPDGRWRLNIAGLNYQSAEFHRLFGDVNGDGTVDGTNDFAAFGNVFGTTVAGSPFDFNADGTVDGPVDFAQFGARFGLTL